MWRGALLGAAAGLGSIFLNGDKEEGHKKTGSDEFYAFKTGEESYSSKILLYTLGGMIAGEAIHRMRKKRKAK